MGEGKKHVGGVRISARVRRRCPRGGHARAVSRVFGLADGHTETLYEGFELTLRPGITAVVGPSGGGKSVLLDRLIAQCKPVHSVGAEMFLQCNVPAIDAISDTATLAERLDAMSRCGLAEAGVMITPACRLSGGQQHRLALASALLTCQPGDTIVADEFAGPLDPPTAEAVAEVFARAVAQRELSAVVATHRWELLPILRPAQVIVKPLAGPAQRLTPRWPIARSWRWRVRRGTIRDYRRLARFHYIAGPPAAHKRVYVILAPRAHRPFGGVSVAAVAVVSPPVLCCRGRNLISAGRYHLGRGGGGIARLNAEVECISRVVVHPIYRGLGLASRLVRHILRTTPMPVVESLAIMGRYHPFFVAAGMTPLVGPAMDYVYFSHIKTPRPATPAKEDYDE